MAHFAEIDSEGIVIRVLGCRDEDNAETVASRHGGVWVQTSYNTRGGIHVLGGTPLRKNYASPGFTYDAVRDAFIPPKPYPSWTLNPETWQYDPPVPSSGGMVRWDEDQLNWVAQ